VVADGPPAAGPLEPGEPAAPVPLASRRRTGVPLWLASVAAVTALVAGLGFGRMSVDTPQAAPVEPEPSGSVVASTALTALDSDAPRGNAEAVRHDDIVTVSVEASSLGDEQGFHEVWLINVDGKRMVALGILARGDDGTFDVPRRLIDEGYRIVDISVEPDDGDPTHSGVSLARGQLA
jgi:anti-sigma-K factor RskA